MKRRGFLKSVAIACVSAPLVVRSAVKAPSANIPKEIKRPIGWQCVCLDGPRKGETITTTSQIWEYTDGTTCTDWGDLVRHGYTCNLRKGTAMYGYNAHH